MILSLEEMAILSKTIQQKDGTYIVKDGLTEEEKEMLKSMDELNVLTYGKHLISNPEKL